MTRYVCIHGHFYQPPRENPWLDAIEGQESAAPYHDWNERITVECYRANGFARVLDRDGRIDRLVNNYARISFNVGPTLMTWLASNDREVYDAILEADRLAMARTGSGAAIAQAHGHLILPLASPRDRRTQVLWGARDFELRFGRRPKGMWLPETAADTASLEALAEAGIEFTVLAPSQAARIRPREDAPWVDVRGARVETRRPYRVRLPSGRSISVFFYDGPTSRAVAFERLLDDGAGFARRLTSLFQPNAHEPQLVHIATDGETYGHHHRFGEMALAYALETLERDPTTRVTSYEAYLRAHPATWEAEIVEGTAWSCAHGVERWRSNCGCSSGAHPGWSQAWRTPLREALDVLRDRTSELIDDEGRALFDDPWLARDEYVDVVAETDPDAMTKAQQLFLDRHVRAERVAREPRGTDGADPEWAVRALSMMELARHAMSMYTSCGWFFDDLSGIETTQVLTYAGRVIQLAHELFEVDLEPAFLAVLGRATSNLPDQGDGAKVYRSHVLPRIASLDRAAAHFAVASLFNEYGEHEALLGFEVHFEERQVRTAGRARLAVGIAAVAARATRQRRRFEYAVIHLCDHHLGVGVRPADGAAARDAMRADLTTAFGQADLTQMLRALEHHFATGIASRVSELPGLKLPPGRASYSLRSLFKDEQKRILDLVLASTLSSVERAYAAIYEQHAPLMRYLAGLGQPVPRAFYQAAQYTLMASIRTELARGDELDLVSLEALVREAQETGVVRRRAGTTPGLTPEETELAEMARDALRSLVVATAAPDATLARVKLAAGLAHFLVVAAITLDHDPAQDHLVRLRDRLLRDGTPDGWQEPFSALLAALKIAPRPSA